MDERKIIDKASHRAAQDPTFAARVEFSIRVAETVWLDEFGRHLTEVEKAIARRAASVALVMADRDPATGKKVEP